MRSWLGVVPSSPQALADALSAALRHHADALVVDLAEGVDPAAKDRSRKMVAAWLRGVAVPLPVWVRINPGPAGHDDARELVGPGLSGLCVAQAQAPVALNALDSLLTSLELEAGIAPRSVPMAPVLSSASAVLAAPAIARGARVSHLQLAEAGLRAELGLPMSGVAGTGGDDSELLLMRSQVVLASGAAGIAAPVAGPWAGAAGVAALRDSTLALRRLGFGGRVCASVDEVDVVNSAFS